MAYFSKFKIGSTSYDVKDAAAGKSLSVSGTSLSLKNAAGTAISTVTLPSGGGGDTMYAFQVNNAQVDPLAFNHTTINVSDIYPLVTANGTYNVTTVSDIVSNCCNGAPAFPCGFQYVPDAYIGDDVWFNFKSITFASGGYECTFESKVYANKFVLQIILTVDTTPGSEAIVSCYGEKLTLGASNKELIVQDQYGNPMSVSQFMSGGTVILYDGEIASGVSDTDLLSDFNAGEVLIHVGGSYDFEKIHFKLDGYNVGSTNVAYGCIYNSGKKLALFSYSGSRKWNLQLIT